MTFKEYLAKRRITDTIAGDFTYNALKDSGFPDVQNWQELKSYLQTKLDSMRCENNEKHYKNVLKAASAVWHAYTRKMRS